MYHPPSFLTREVLVPVLARFDWPAAYELHARHGGVVIALPRCELLVDEGFESDMAVLFLPASTGHHEAIDARLACGVLSAERTFPPHPPYLELRDARASVDKVRDETENRLRLVFTMFPASLSGDFSWVPEYLRLRAAELGASRQ